MTDVLMSTTTESVIAKEEIHILKEEVKKEEAPISVSVHDNDGGLEEDEAGKRITAHQNVNPGNMTTTSEDASAPGQSSSVSGEQSVSHKNSLFNKNANSLFQHSLYPGTAGSLGPSSLALASNQSVLQNSVYEGQSIFPGTSPANCNAGNYRGNTSPTMNLSTRSLKTVNTTTCCAGSAAAAGTGGGGATSKSFGGGKSRTHGKNDGSSTTRAQQHMSAAAAAAAGGNFTPRLIIKETDGAIVFETAEAKMSLPIQQLQEFGGSLAHSPSGCGGATPALLGPSGIEVPSPEEHRNFDAWLAKRKNELLHLKQEQEQQEQDPEPVSSSETDSGRSAQQVQEMNYKDSPESSAGATRNDTEHGAGHENRSGSTDTECRPGAEDEKMEVDVEEKSGADGETNEACSRLKIPDQPIERRVHVPQSAVGLLMGKNGSTLQGLRNQYGSFIKLDQSTRDFGYSVCTLFDFEEENLNCLEADILQLAEDAGKGKGNMRKIGQGGWTSTRSRGSPVGAGHMIFNAGGSTPSGAGQEQQLVHDKVEVPLKYVGMIIGNSGTTIQKIKHFTGADVQMTCQMNPGKKVTQLSGTREQVDLAKEIILKMVKSGEQKWSLDSGPGNASAASGANGANTSATRQKKLPGLEFLDQNPTPRHAVAFIPTKFLGMLIGKHGENIRRVRESVREKSIWIHVVNTSANGVVYLKGPNKHDLTALKDEMTQNLFKAISAADHRPPPRGMSMSTSNTNSSTGWNASGWGNGSTNGGPHSNSHAGKGTSAGKMNAGSHYSGGSSSSNFFAGGAGGNNKGGNMLGNTIMGQSITNSHGGGKMGNLLMNNGNVNATLAQLLTGVANIMNANGSARTCASSSSSSSTDNNSMSALVEGLLGSAVGAGGGPSCNNSAGSSGSGINFAKGGGQQTDRSWKSTSPSDGSWEELLNSVLLEAPLGSSSGSGSRGDTSFGGSCSANSGLSGGPQLTTTTSAEQSWATNTSSLQSDQSWAAFLAQHYSSKMHC
eukprot:g18397.t1